MRKFQIFLLVLSLLVILEYFPWQSYRPSQVGHFLHAASIYPTTRTSTTRRGNTGTKYLSYKPSGGGWNNQRVAVENAIVLAKLLNRTLIIHPVEPHIGRKSSKKDPKPKWLPKHRTRFMYNSIPPSRLIPISKVLDLDVLRKLLPVIEETGTQQEFREKYKHLRWKTICHNCHIGFWIDQLPLKSETKLWEQIQSKIKLKNLTAVINAPHRRICKEEILAFDQDPTKYSFWGIENELENIKDDIIYFSEGCLYPCQIYFTNPKRAENAKDWIATYYKYAAPIQESAARIVRFMNGTYNAIHVRRTDHRKSKNYNQSYWISMLRKERALSTSKKLFISTDERNTTWFDPFHKEGYSMIFGHDISHLIDYSGLAESGFGDYLGFHEQLVCTKAQRFVGSPYSSFTGLIALIRSQQFGPISSKSYYHIQWLDRRHWSSTKATNKKQKLFSTTLHRHN